MVLPDACKTGQNTSWDAYTPTPEKVPYNGGTIRSIEKLSQLPPVVRVGTRATSKDHVSRLTYEHAQQTMRTVKKNYNRWVPCIVQMHSSLAKQLMLSCAVMRYQRRLCDLYVWPNG